MIDDASAVAVVGMSGRFPGARDIGEFWRNLRDGVCSIADFSADDLLAAGVGEAELRHPGYVPSKGYLPDADRFEAGLFGFNRAEAAVLDPQHRLLLEGVWTALEDAGRDPLGAPARTGVYVGGSLTEHMIAAHADQRLAGEIGGMQLRVLTDREFLAPWVSYRMGLTGPSLTVQTACSTSLMAVHLAVQALLLGECDTAIAGGVSVDSVHPRGYVYRQGGIYSPDGRCRPFDAQAAGTVGGSGVGVVVLRRLTDARAAADPVRAVIAGTAATNDGSDKVGFTAPSVTRQAAAMTEAWACAGLDPARAGYLEMHGTATSLGDQVEVAAVRTAFAATADAADGAPGSARRRTAPRGTERRGTERCAIGSVKSNIGHLDAAAGVAGLIKAVLMLEHGMLVPTVNVGRPHPGLGLEEGPLEVVTRATGWELPEAGLRLAGVTGVGIGGSNVHVVLAEAEPEPEPARPGCPGGMELLPLSAWTQSQLAISARRLARELRSARAPALADAGHVLRTGRARLPVRGYVLASDAAGAAAALEAIAEGRPVPVPPGAPGLRALGESWCRGEDVTWPPSAPGARGAHLPTYPFAGASHGALSLPGARPQAPAPPEQEATVAAATVSDLLTASLGLADAGDLGQSYFAAGGDSLTAVHLIGRLHDDFGAQVPVELFFEELTLSELAGRIAAIAAGAHGAMLDRLLDEIDEIEANGQTPDQPQTRLSGTDSRYSTAPSASPAARPVSSTAASGATVSSVAPARAAGSGAAAPRRR